MFSQKETKCFTSHTKCDIWYTPIKLIAVRSYLYPKQLRGKKLNTLLIKKCIFAY